MRRLILIAVVCAFMSVPAFADFSTIQGGSGEPDLWQVLNVVAPITGGWGSTLALNTNTSGRRVLDRPDVLGDIYDQIWADGTVDVSVNTLFWGGTSYPFDSANQYFRYDEDLDGSSPINLTGLDDPGDSDSFSVTDRFIIGDGGGTYGAWSRESLNSGPLTDRMVTFDVSGLNIYAWTAGDKISPTTTLLSSSIAGPAYIVAFDPGGDGDYQDMLVLIERAKPVPVPGAVLLGILGLSVAGVKLRKFA